MHAETAKVSGASNSRRMSCAVVNHARSRRRGSPSSFAIPIRMLCNSLLWVLVCVLVSCTGRPGDGREGGSDKIEWSILQSLEAKHRDSPAHDVEFIETDGYHIICVPGHDDQKRVWIMMDPKSAPFYKQLPSGNYWLTADQIESIRRRANPISTVLQVLESHKKAQ